MDESNGFDVVAHIKSYLIECESSLRVTQRKAEVDRLIRKDIKNET